MDNNKKTESIKCFVIMPISNQTGYDSDHFKFVYEDIIGPAIKKAGMEAFRADETKNTNLIQLDILRNVIESPIAICDMSSKNPNVFYELGMRQAFDLPTVLLKDDITDAPFDISGLRYVTYNKAMSHRNVVAAINELSETLTDTYNKRGDKAEINSLIRLMELTMPPAQLNVSELNEEDRHEKLIEIQLNNLSANFEILNRSNQQMLSAINNMQVTSGNKMQVPSPPPPQQSFSQQAPPPPPPQQSFSQQAPPPPPPPKQPSFSQQVPPPNPNFTK